ncbi:MAG: hypothetical protein JWN83_2104 [Chitinophagaceae bacterium]|nr:hypothetical protein [Chitinophagaceae bacterium]
MPVYYLMIHAKPLKHNIEELDVAGAYVNCWIVSDKIEEAEQIAKQKLHELKWDTVNVEESTVITEKNYLNDPAGMEIYEQVLIDKEVYTFHTYESEDNS